MKCKMPVARLVVVREGAMYVGRDRYVACQNRVSLLRWAVGRGCVQCETRSVG